MSFKLSTLTTFDDIDPHLWDGLAHPPGSIYNPFISYAFLQALEKSGSAVPGTGWAAQHLILYDAQDIPRAAMPLYVKAHSQGEYIFDHGWADAFERAGGQYYPKLLCAVPFTPVTGARLLTGGSDDYNAPLIQGAINLTTRYNISSLHINFLPPTQNETLSHYAFLSRTDQQFHWHNHNYQSFDDFLAALSARKRKAIKKERARAIEAGIEIEWLSGAQLTEAHWDAFFDFYMDTGMRKWGQPYLTRDFFSLITESMAQDILLILAKRDGRYIAGALNFIGGDTLYGRNWGCCETHPFLHFELCYYQAMDYAITHKLKIVEAGAQGAHKLARGYVPTHIYSAHFIPQDGFRQAVAHYLESERDYVEQDINRLNEFTPFKKQEKRS